LERLPGFVGRLVSTPNEDDVLINMVQDNPFTTAVDAVNSSNFPGSVWTARWRLRPSGVRNHLIQNDAPWSRVIFSRTKKSFSLSSPNGRLRVYRLWNIRYEERSVEKTERSEHFSVNMWPWTSTVHPGILLHVEYHLIADVYIRIFEDDTSVTPLLPNGDRQDNWSVQCAHGPDLT
jgi:hypothetical protein